MPDEFWEVVHEVFASSPVSVKQLQKFVKNPRTGGPYSMSELYRFSENPRNSGVHMPPHVMKAVTKLFKTRRLVEWIERGNAAGRVR